MRLVLRQQAHADLRNIMAWFREQDERMEIRFIAALEAELNYIKRFPRGYQFRKPPYRFAMLNTFKFFLIYVVEEDEVVVHRVRHIHQKPLMRYFGG